MSFFSQPQPLPRVGDEVFIENDFRTVTSLARNAVGDPLVCWESSRESGACMLSIWQEWAKYSKLDKPLPKTRRSDMFD